jgi:hypothetical protein
MSIAVSIVIKPSRLVFAATSAICLGCALIGAAVGLGRIGEQPFAMRIAIAAACIAASLGAFCYAAWSRKAHHVDISGIGQIRLMETTAVAGLVSGDNSIGGRRTGEVVTLMDDSTLWPGLMVLRLQTADRRIRTVIVLPDSVDRHGFRALSVACRWIAAHSDHSRQPDLQKNRVDD